MKTLSIKAYVEFGKGDADNWDMDVEVTNKEYALLEKIAVAMNGVSTETSFYVREVFDGDVDITNEEYSQFETLKYKIDDMADKYQSKLMLKHSWEYIEDYVQREKERGNIRNKTQWRASSVYDIGVTKIYL